MIERAGQSCAIGSALFERIHQPYNDQEDRRAGALRFGRQPQLRRGNPERTRDRDGERRDRGRNGSRGPAGDGRLLPADGVLHNPQPRETWLRLAKARRQNYCSSWRLVGHTLGGAPESSRYTLDRG